MEANNILFRCSGAGHLMVEPQGKSNLEKYLDATETLAKYQSDYAGMKKLGGKGQPLKSAQKKMAQIEKQKAIVESLEAVKFEKDLAEGVKTHCVDIFVSDTYNRFNELSAKQLDKGNETEEESVTTVSRITKRMFTKNNEHLSNEYIKGTPDLFEGSEITKATVIRDVKSSWDAYSFFRAKHKSLNPLYYWQGLGYMWLTGAEKCIIDYCLNNTPWHLVLRELSRESYNHPDNDTPTWIELQIIANHTYDLLTFHEYIGKRGIAHFDDNSLAVIRGFVEIPLEERHFSREFDRSEEDIERLKKRIEDARKWMSKNLYKELEPVTA